MWFWVQPEHGDHEDSNFYWNRDCIYIGILLLGMGGATLMVLSLSMVSILIGDFTVSQFMSIPANRVYRSTGKKVGQKQIYEVGTILLKMGG